PEEVAVLCQVRLHPPTGVDAVVVEHEMDAPGPSVQEVKPLEQGYEQVAVLALGRDEHQVTPVDGEGAGDVPLGGLAGRDHVLLSGWQDPVAADARVEMDVDLVLEVGDLVGAQVTEDLPDRPETARLAGFGPGAEHDRTRHAPAGTQVVEHPGDRRDAHVDTGPATQRAGQRFAGPCRTRPAMVL